jgi:transcriptional regulator CtsR
MAKKEQKQTSALHAQLLEKLDFTATQKQVDDLMKTVLCDNILNKNKIRFIQEQLHDQRYQINPKIIANKMFEHMENADSEVLSV